MRALGWPVLAGAVMALGGCQLVSGLSGLHGEGGKAGTTGSGGHGATTGSGGHGGITGSGGGTGGGTSSATASSSSGNLPCTTVMDCPTGTPCEGSACTMGKCVLTPVPKGMACLGTAGVCDDTGTCVTCFPSSGAVFGCPGSGDYCYMDACASCADQQSNGDETDVDCGGTHCPACADGHHCGVPGDCSSNECTNGRCTSCSDGTKNGDETDVDCGGSCATKCAVTKACSDDGDCQTNACAGGMCCNMACSGQCHSCVLSGHVGTCTPIPDGEAGACSAGNLCVTGLCQTASKSPIGAVCSAPGNCAGNSICKAHYCKLQNGDACNDPMECASGICSGYTCKACTGDGDCVSNSCDVPSGTCKLPSDYFCAGPSDCLINVCTSNFCTKPGLASCAVDADCANHRCINATCAACNTNADCASGKCSGPGGYCFAPTGTYCLTNGECASGVCMASAASPIFRHCQ